MCRPILTLWAMYQYDTTLFDRMLIPETLDREALLGYFFMYAGKNESRYGDPDELKKLIEMWSRARVTEWKRMCEALQAEYSPIENYDRTEEHEETERENSSGNTIGNDTTTENSNGTEENKVSAFDSNTYQPKNSASSSISGESRVNRTIEESGNRDVTRTNNIRAHGNIGVTTNQQMIQSELELRMYNIYKEIALEFEDEFTVPIYERRCYNGLL